MTATVTLLVDEQLRLFLSLRDRSGTVRLEQDGTSSLGHLVQSVGVPLTEVGELVVGHGAEPPSYRPSDGDVVEVRPVARPQPAPVRFLLDGHLGSLARRMRLLGIDTAYDGDARDDDLVAVSLAEDRVLLSKDRGLLMRRALRHAAYVRGERADDQLADVLQRFPATLAPFTRCTSCNGALVAVPKAAVLDRLEPGTRRTYEEFARCTSCHRVYWQGAHSRRLQAVVAAARRWSSSATGSRCPEP